MLPNKFTEDLMKASHYNYCQEVLIGTVGVEAAYSACNRKVVGSNPGSALLILEVNVVNIQLRALLGLCSLLVHSANVRETVCEG